MKIIFLTIKLEYHISSCCRWWDCIALPDDVDTCDEASFRMEIQDLAFIVCFSSNMISTFTYLLKNLFVVLVIMLKLLMGDDDDSIISIFQSLQLLKDAIFDIECAPCILSAGVKHVEYD